MTPGWPTCEFSASGFDTKSITIDAALRTAEQCRIENEKEEAVEKKRKHKK